MSRDIYPALSGAVAAWRHLEVLGNNLANMGTEGFKGERVAFEATGRADGGSFRDAYVRVGERRIDLSDGPVERDGVSTHVALRGRGFFRVEGPSGEELLVRNGRFRLDDQRRLVTAAGEAVLGEGGPIQVPENTTITVAADGRITTDQGDEIGRLSVVIADDIEPVGAGHWRALGPTRPAEGVELVQGALEGSNADPIKGMTELVEAGRYFDFYQKAMQTSDELDGRLNELARSR